MSFSGTHPGDFIRRGKQLVEAIQWQGNNYNEVYRWVMKWDLADPGISNFDDGYLRVSNHRGEAHVKEGEFLVRDIIGEFFFPMPAKEFEELFEEA